MIKKVILLTLGTVSFVVTPSSCTPRVKVPGDINVQTRTVETERIPGNILEKGSLRAAGAP